MLVQELDRLVWALTLIVLGEVKIYLANFDVKWQKNILFTFYLLLSNFLQNF